MTWWSRSSSARDERSWRYRLTFSVFFGGRSLAISTAIHGSGMEIARMIRRIFRGC